MKIFKELVLALGVMVAGSAMAQEEVSAPEVKGQYAVGISSGTKDGLSVAYSKEDDKFYQGKLSMSEDETALSADMLFLQPEVTKSVAMAPYFGIGLGFSESYKAETVKVGDIEMRVGKDVRQANLRVPVGLLLTVPSTPLQIGMEVAPTVPLEPQGKASMDTALNLRMLL